MFDMNSVSELERNSYSATVHVNSYDFPSENLLGFLCHGLLAIDCMLFKAPKSSHMFT